MPHSRQRKPDHDYAPGKLLGSEKLADSQKVGKAGSRQANKEVRSAPLIEVA